jgi:hypothetical protein
MYKIVTFLLFVFIFATSKAADTLFVKLNKHELKKNDTLFLDCLLKFENKEESKITLNVIIESIDKLSRWKYRYPLLQGYSAPAIIIDSSIMPGDYAVNCLIQKDFLKLSGKVKDHNPKSKGFNYLMLGKNQSKYIGLVNADKAGYFTTQKMLFEDTARFIFSEIGKKNEFLFIDLQTSIDSTYQPVAEKTEFIKIITTNGNPSLNNTSNYKFDRSQNLDFTLKEAVVNSVKKKKVELFDEAYSTGLFKFGFPFIFDGIEENDMGNSMDIFSYLQGRVAGLKIHRDVTGSYALSWRGGIVDVYLDEFKVDDDISSMVNPNDIAMVKVYSPMSGGPTGNGTIAIYTKRGPYTNNATRKYNFLIKGYSPLISVWKNF